MLRRPRPFAEYDPLCTLDMTRRRFHRTAEVIPRRPWKSKNPFASRSTTISINKGTQGERTRYDAGLLPFISIVQSPGHPVISAPRQKKSKKSKRSHFDSFSTFFWGGGFLICWGSSGPKGQVGLWLVCAFSTLSTWTEACKTPTYQGKETTPKNTHPNTQSVCLNNFRNCSCELSSLFPLN